MRIDSVAIREIYLRLKESLETSVGSISGRKIVLLEVESGRRSAGLNGKRPPHRGWLPSSRCVPLALYSPSHGGGRMTDFVAADARHTKNSIIIYIMLTVALSSIFYLLVIYQSSTSGSLGLLILGLMWCPGV